MTTHYVYKITNLATGKIYVGCTSHMEKRLLSHRTARPEILGENYSVEILETLPTKGEARKRESLFIQMLDAAEPEIGYNRDIQFSTETRRRMSEAAKSGRRKWLSPNQERLAQEIELLEGKG